MLAHPVNVIRQTLDISQSFVTLFPRLDKGLMLHSFFLTILLLKRLRAGCVILAKGRDILSVERCGILVASNGRASEILCPWDNRSPPNGCIQ